jgi:hypothetical protein
MKFKLIVMISMLVSFCSAASGEDFQAAIEFQVGSVGSSSAWIPWQEFPGIGSSLYVVGLVQNFNAPFQDLLPPAGTYEATYSIEGLTCTENIMWDDFEHQLGGKGAAYSNGTLRIYIDYTPDANLADPSTFRDGEMVLEAQLAPPNVMGAFVLSEGGCYYPELQTLSGYFHFSGGTWFNRVKDSNREGCAASIAGCFWGNISEALREMGYVGQSSSRLDIYSVVAVKATSWGQIKELFR